MSFPSSLLEREAELALLAERAERLARPGPAAGGCVLVHGEAGIGKTSLLRQWRAAMAPRPWRWWVGRCEPLASPAPLHPLLDWLDDLPPPLADGVAAGRLGPGLLAGLLGELRDARRPTLLVIDDAQWADEATLDLLRFIGRRIEGTRALLVLACRDEALAPGQPLLALLGHLATAPLERIALQPLSAAAVAAWAQRLGRADEPLHAVSGGNPFFVSELLAGPAGRLPPTVREAVLARVARLPAPTQALLQALCVLPGAAEAPLLQALATPGVPSATLEVASAARFAGAAAAAGTAEHLRPALEAGLLVEQGSAVGFRHELARQALAGALQPPQARERHAAAEAALRQLGASAMRRLHHAEQAGLAAVLRELAPAAAAEAAAAGQPRQAARLYGQLLAAAADDDDAAVRAGWLEARAEAWGHANELDEAIADRGAALALRRQLGDLRGAGRNGLWLARLHWQRSGDVGLALPWVEQAIADLERLPPVRERVEAYSTRAHLHLVGDDMTGTLQWGERALAMAETLGEPLALIHALNNVGTARVRLGEAAAGLAALQRSLALAGEHQALGDAARARLNLFLVQAAQRDFAPALAQADAGVQLAERHGLDVYTVRLRVRRAHALLLCGRFAEAAGDLAELARRHQPGPMEAAAVAYVGALLALRRGEPAARPRLERAVAAMRRHQVELWFLPTAAARAEAAWLAGEADGVAEAVHAAWAAFAGPADPWRQGELALWLHRAGRPLPAAGRAWPRPQALELAGEHEAAARAWQALGCRYDALLALAGGPPAAQREALLECVAIGAEPLARRLRRQLRAAGLGAGTRGAYRHARSDPLGLTPRQREVLQMLAEGLTNREIGLRLQRSERTVEKHVAQLLAKLEVEDRQAAVRRGRLLQTG